MPDPGDIDPGPRGPAPETAGAAWGIGAGRGARGANHEAPGRSEGSRALDVPLRRTVLGIHGDNAALTAGSTVPDTRPAHHRRFRFLHQPAPARVTPAARAACFSATPEHAASMLYQCERRAPGTHPSRTQGAPQDAQSANLRRNPRKGPQTRQRPRAPATAVSPLYSSRIDNPFSSGTRTDDHAVPARFWSTPSMPCPDTRGTPESTPRIHGRRPTNLEKSPICNYHAEFPAIKVMHGVLRRLHKSPTVQSLARKTALLPPGSPTEPNSSLIGTPDRRRRQGLRAETAFSRRRRRVPAGRPHRPAPGRRRRGRPGGRRGRPPPAGEAAPLPAAGDPRAG